MRYGVLIVAAGTLLATEAFSAPRISNSDLQTRLRERAKQECYESRTASWKRLGLESPCELVRRDSGPGVQLNSVLARFQRGYRVTTPVARLMLAAELANGLLEEESSGSGPARPRPLDFLWPAARAAPGNVAVLLACLRETGMDPLFAGHLLGALEGSPNPVSTALQLLEAERFSAWGARLAAFVLQRDPALVARVLESFGTGHSDLDATVVYLQMLRLPQARTNLTEVQRARVADRIARNLIDDGLYPLAVATLRALSERERELVLDGKVGAVDLAYTSKGTSEVPARDARVGLALAFLTQGDLDTARSLFLAALVADGEPDDLRRDPGCIKGVERAVLDWHVREQRVADPFDLAVQAELCEWNSSLALALDSVLGSRYRPVITRQLEREIEVSRSRGGAMDRAVLAVLAPEETREIARAKANRSKELEEMLRTVQRPPSPARNPEPAVFVQKPLPAGVDAYEGGEQQSCVRDRIPVELPEGFWPVRVERIVGARLLAVALSQNLDPTGEVSGGAYWLLESRDDGKTWEKPIYMGLREYRPYVLVPESKLPIVDGDVLRLEVRIRELDDRSVTFPPIATRAKREQNGVYLEARLQDLARDSDGDGLTDLEEERLLTDPARVDTDGDGEPDGTDAMPQVSAGPRTRDSDLLTAFLAAADERAPNGLVTGLEDDGSGLRLPRDREPVGSARVRLLIADREALRGARPTARTIVLTRDEYEAAVARFGTFYPLEIRKQFRNEAGDRVFLEYSERWRGGTAVGRFEDGTWVIEIVNAWIT